MLTLCFSIVFIFSLVSGQVLQYEGDRCVLKSGGEKGKCVILDDCNYAKDLIKSRQRPQHCGFKGLVPIVCCPLQKSSGEKSQKKCEEYYPRIQAHYNTFLFGGKKSLAKEFPHVAALGYGEKSEIQWLCGGSLISDEFVLTAAHCLNSKDLGDVKWVRLGDLDLVNTTDDAKPQEFAIEKAIRNPRYQSSSHYNDIALLKLNGKASFNVYVKPACLYTNLTWTGQLMATGWGRLEFYGESSSHLMKVDLNHIEYKKCADTYKGFNRKLEKGIIDDMQICAGSPDGKDTCPGDSGGPLQIKTKTSPFFFYIVGVTSFGRACGVQESVGVYTRVSNYLGWIENVVWPGK